ncbi:MAG: site-specific DNA-methyltransferase [Acidobacteriota bacterium]|nr:site-specific DNA-methyltransferase [Acidobacteriota bacterium]
MVGIVEKTKSKTGLSEFRAELAAFSEFGAGTIIEQRNFGETIVPVYQNEFWTAKQRSGHSIHEISYRACYKPQLPRFFIERLTQKNDVVYDPFLGRGTTLIEANLLGRRVVGNDVNPLSEILTAPRLSPPNIFEIKQRLDEVFLEKFSCDDSELLVFFNHQTLSEILAWRKYFAERRENNKFDKIDSWIEMVACNRLTGHSKGFFSVYTLPPNQAASVKSQQRINEKCNQTPEYRNTKEIIYRKSHQLLRVKLSPNYGQTPFQINIGSADSTPEIKNETIDLIVTSPPFLDVVNYRQDNWLRMWLANAEIEENSCWQIKNLDDWLDKMKSSLREFYRVLKSSGVIAFEVGEVHKGNLLLENEIVRIASEVGFVADCILINAQNFTKTANCWGVKNNEKGTNTNRIVILTKSATDSSTLYTPRPNTAFQQLTLF